MSTFQMSVLGINTVPDNSGNCWSEPFPILATNDVWGLHIIRFGSSNAAEPTTRIGLRGQFTVPQNYVGTARFLPIWTASVTTGAVAWDIDYRVVAGSDLASLDQAGVQESITQAASAPSAVFRRMAPTLVPTAGNFSAGATVLFELFRDGTDAADTMAASAILFDLLFQYQDV